ncbi:Pam17-domain-containing protein [Xylariomycetidae sp. FL0641]|nr:Pam17-domain-containing protein [Xylariomycetidae sp. FL0641]
MLTTTTTAATRFGVLGARGLQLPTTFTRGACPYSSLAALAQRQCAARAPKQYATKTRAPVNTSTSTSIRCQLLSRRHATTTANSTSNTAAAADSSSSVPLDWNSFFQLRKTRRRYQIAGSIISMFATSLGGSIFLVNYDLDWALSLVPIDPMFSLGVIVFGCAGLGWLAGPSLGNALFYTVKRGIKKPMAIKESEFFARIKKNRVDPSNSSLSGNAVPDFYGEKISSVAGYRQWMKDQRAFNKKRTSFI